MAFFELRTISENNDGVLTFVTQSHVYDFSWDLSMCLQLDEGLSYVTKQNRRVFLSVYVVNCTKPIDQLTAPKYRG